MDRPTQMLLTFPEENLTAVAEILWDKAPRTCAGLVEAGPFSGKAHHGIYSGSECVLLLDRVLRLPPENATSKVKPGDVGFTWMAAGSGYGVRQDFAEICWFYDIDAEPRMWEGPVAVSIFARIPPPAEAFFAIGFRMRREGVKPLTIRFA
jgi:hypothetical protein